jgi:hypothetical protein
MRSTFSGTSPGIRDERCSRIPRKRSIVSLPETAVSFESARFEMELPSFMSATAREAFFSALRSSRSDESSSGTFPSLREAASSSATAALSNLTNFLSFSLEE